MAEGGIALRQAPSKRWTLGNNVYLGRGVILDIAPAASLHVGDDVKVMHMTVIGVAESLTIGRRTQIAEHCTIRDQNHDTAGGLDMISAPVVSAATTIGERAWIGRGVAVLAGSCVGDGAVIAANSVVIGSIPDDAIAAGSPARVLRQRR